MLVHQRVGLEMQKSEATKQPPLHMLDLVSFVTSLKGKRDAFNAAPEHVCSSHIELNIRASTRGMVEVSVNLT